MPAVDPALDGSWHKDIGVPHFACLPSSATLAQAKLEAAAASAPESATERSSVERMSALCQAELKLHPPIAKAVAAFKEGMERASLPRSPASVCVVELYLCVFISLAQVVCNLGVDPVAILCVLATDPTSNILNADSTTGYNAPEAGILDLKLYKLLSVVFASVPEYSSFVGDHFGRIGQSGRNAMMGFLLSLYRIQELHKRTDVLLTLCTNCATPFHDEKWGGGHIRTLVDKLKRQFTVNKLLVVLFSKATEGMLSITQEEVCFNVLLQQRTPFDMPFLLTSMAEQMRQAKAGGSIITFAELILLLQRCLSSDFFPTSSQNPSINVHNPDTVDEVDSVTDGSPAKKPKREKRDGCP